MKNTDVSRTQGMSHMIYMFSGPSGFIIVGYVWQIFVREAFLPTFLPSIREHIKNAYPKYG